MACEFQITPDVFPWYCSGNMSLEEDSIESFFNNEITNSPQDLHFRIVFYSDPQKQIIVHAAFSQDNTDKWFYRNGNDVNPFSKCGIKSVVSKPELRVIYRPKILPSDFSESQHDYSVDGNGLYSKPLVRGVKYYVDIAAAISGDIKIFDSKTVIFSSYDEASENRLNINTDDKRWTCSGQGKNDIRVTQTSGNTLFPVIAANRLGIYSVIWEDYRYTDSQSLSVNKSLFTAIYNSDLDIGWWSGNGFQDTKIDGDASGLIIQSDNLENFYILYNHSGVITDKRLIRSQSSSSSAKTDVEILEETNFNINEIGRDVMRYAKIRIADSDTKGSFIVSGSKIVSVIDDCLVKLDVIGVPGVIAIRLQNEDDSQWSDWISVEEQGFGYFSSSSSSSSSASGPFSASKIDGERYIVPWVVSPGNGVKTVYCQLLTAIGISDIFYTDILLNMQEPNYELRFFSDGGYSQKLPVFNGFPVVVKNSSSSSVVGQYANVYIEVEFGDKDRLDRILSLSTTERFNWLPSSVGTSFTFNVIQEGIEDQYNLSLNLVSGSRGVFRGQFTVYQHDGILNKDGLSSISINMPDPCLYFNSNSAIADSYASDNTFLIGGAADKLNAMNIPVMGDNSRNYKDIWLDVNADSIAINNKPIDVKEFTSLYNIDDPRFSFGNPKFFEDKK